MVAAAVVLLLVVAYPASIGPAAYAAWRGWLPFHWYLAVYDGPWKALGETPPAVWWDRYATWWSDLAKRHRGAAAD